MTAAPVRLALRRSLDQIQHVAVVRPGRAGGHVAAVYAQVERDFGMLAPPIALHAPAPGPLAASWLMLRETLLVQGVASRPAKEAVAAAVSLSNSCPYCVAVHTAVLGGLARGQEAAAITAGRLESITDPVVRDIALWARSSGQRKAAGGGPVPLPALPFPAVPFPAVPFPTGQLAELAGVAVTFQYLNRMVTLFLADSPLPGAVPGPVAGGLMRVLGRFLRPAALASPEPGASLSLLPDPPRQGPALPAAPLPAPPPHEPGAPESAAPQAPKPEPPMPAPALPAGLAWAAGNWYITAAFGRASAAIEAAGTTAVPEPVRELVLGELAGWTGQPRGPSRSWSDDSVAALPAAVRPAGRLALLTAFAPYQVGPRDIAEFRRARPTDEDLIAVTSWASLAAARRAGTWLG